MKTKIPSQFLYCRFFIPSRIALVAMALGAATLALTAPARAQEDVAVGVQADVGGGSSFRLFYDKLGDQGDWIQTQQYGYVFQPKVVATNHHWRPYTDGYWAQTNAGWTWVSNEDHGWATYHYGRWANVVDTGWVWVPGNDWSPGNVSWRVSRDHKHVGWAPLPPEARIERGEEVGGWVDTAYDIGPESYTFIETNHFGENSYSSHIVPVEQNVTIITETENVTRVSYRTVDTREVVYNGGPEVTIFTERGGPPVRHLDLELRPQNVGYFQQQRDYRGISSVEGNRLVVATATREVITSNTIRVSEPAHVTRRLETVQVDRGYRGLGDQQTIERVRTQMRTQSPTPPPQVEQRATAALRKNGTNFPPANPANSPGAAATPERDRKPGNVPPGASPAVSPASASPAREHGPGRNAGEPTPNEPKVRPSASPMAKPGTETPAPKPGASPTPERENATPEPHTTPGATHPGGTPAAVTPHPHASASPNAEHPAASPAEPKGENEPRGEHPRQPGAPAHPQASPEPGNEPRQKPPGQRPTVPAVTPPEAADPSHEAHTKPEPQAKPEHAKPDSQAKPEAQPKPEHAKPESQAKPEAQPKPEHAKPEAEPKSAEHAHPGAAEPAQHKEPAAAKEPAEKKPAAPKSEAAPAHHNPGEEHAGGAKPEHASKEKAGSEDKKETPKP